MSKSREAEPYELYEPQELFDLREPYEPGDLYELDGLNLPAVQNGGTSAAIAVYRCPAVCSGPRLLFAASSRAHFFSGVIVD